MSPLVLRNDRHPFSQIPLLVPGAMHLRTHRLVLHQPLVARPRGLCQMMQVVVGDGLAEARSWQSIMQWLKVKPPRVPRLEVEGQHGRVVVPFHLICHLPRVTLCVKIIRLSKIFSRTPMMCLSSPGHNQHGKIVREIILVEKTIAGTQVVSPVDVKTHATSEKATAASGKVATGRMTGDERGSIKGVAERTSNHVTSKEVTDLVLEMTTTRESMVEKVRLRHMALVGAGAATGWQMRVRDQGVVCNIVA